MPITTATAPYLATSGCVTDLVDTLSERRGTCIVAADCAYASAAAARSDRGEPGRRDDRGERAGVDGGGGGAVLAGGEEPCFKLT